MDLTRTKLPGKGAATAVVFGHLFLIAGAVASGRPIFWAASLASISLSYSCFLWGVRAERDRQQLSAAELDYGLEEDSGGCPYCGREGSVRSRAVH